MASNNEEEIRVGKYLPEGVSFGWLVAIVAFLLTQSSQGFSGDLRALSGWMEQLRTGGYSAVHANYPPLVLHWLWLGGAILNKISAIQIPLEIFKSWLVFPVWIAWMALIYQVGRVLECSGIRPKQSLVFWLTVLNPAVIVDGPQWGQVDLLPWIPISCGLFAHQKGRHALAPVFFILAVAIKFQAIVYAPIFAGLYFKALASDRRVLWAVPMTAVALIISFLPFVLVGKAWDQVARAYWNNIGIMPSASNNAANLWTLLGVQYTRSSVPLFNSEWLYWLTPQVLGLSLFALCACAVFVRSTRKDVDVWGMAVTANICFFAFCPEMHERYIFGAVPAAALWAAQDRSKISWYIVITGLCLLNIWLVFFPRNQHEWSILSALVVGAAAVLLLCALGVRASSKIMWRLDRYPYLSTGIFSLAPLILVFLNVHAYIKINLSAIEIGENIDLAAISPVRMEQQYGVTTYQRISDPAQFAFSDAAIRSGIKVHAKSILQYQLPPGRFELIGKCGPERIANIRSAMRFSIVLGKEIKWESETTSGPSRSMPFSITLVGPADLSLILDPLGTNFGDHGLWGDVYLRRLE